LGAVCSADGGCLPLTTAAPVLGKITDGAWVSLSAVLLAGGGCGADGAWVSLSPAVLLTDGMFEPTVTSAGIGAVDEFTPNHAHNAAAQTPTIANTLAAAAALPSLIRPLVEPRCFCAAMPGLDATAPALIA